MPNHATGRHAAVIAQRFMHIVRGPRAGVHVVLLGVCSLIAACGSGGGGGGGSSGGSDGGTPMPDIEGPRVSLRLSHEMFINPNDQLTATFTFTEPVSGFTATDVYLVGGTSGALTAINATTYQLPITASGDSGSDIIIHVRSNAAQDAAGNSSIALSHVFYVAIAYAPWATAAGRDTAGVWADLPINGNGINMTQRFRLMSAITHQLGSPTDEIGRTVDETMHQVALTKGYWIADSECSQGIWKAVTGSNPSQDRKSVV